MSRDVLNEGCLFLKRRLSFLVIFSVAMGFLEAVVVVYLRQLYYPDGFAFPLKIIALEGLSIEYLREISTIVMLLSVSVVAGRNLYERLAYFLFCFGVWDIFYYIWLKVLLNWPPSLLTWDILFLIPVAWSGPVLAPIICSVTIIMLAGSIMFFQRKGYAVKISLLEWALLGSSAVIIFSTFIFDYLKIIIKGGFLPKIFTLGTDPHFQKIVSSYIPTSYNWYLFILGEGLLVFSLIIFCRRMRLAKN
ncbi:MAG: hypothetical protein AB1610_06410 [Nitrospirota bacterium]